MASQVGREMPMVEAIVLPLLRTGLPGHVTVTSWDPDVDARTFPLFHVRQLGGLPDPRRPDLLDKPVVELTAYSTGKDSVYKGYAGTKDLLLDAQFILFQAVRNQTVVDGVGYLHSHFQTMGPIQLDSPFNGTWRWQSLVQYGLRPAN
jgi:hypothetical protein